MLRSVFAFAFLTLPATAQDMPIVFPLSDVLDLAALSHLDMSGFERALAEVLPIASTPSPPPDGPLDPFLWSLNGHFGSGGERARSGAIFSCARYGLGTRDAFAEYGQTAHETFALLSLARPQFDDAEVWPEGAVARLYCAFVWDDRRVVEILPEPATRAALAQVFGTLAVLPQDLQSRLLYGEEGFRIDASNGPGNSVVRVESARMTLTLGHQSLSFRSFLMGGLS